MRVRPKEYSLEPVIGLEAGRDRFADTAAQFLKSHSKAD
jgi:hypothetical protein